MKTFKTTHRIIAVLLSVMMLLTVSPVAFASADQYPGYEYVVTADKTSVKSDDTLIITITANGPMAYASMLQFQLVYDSTEFTTTKAAATAYETEWYNAVRNGAGLGAISKPSFGNKAYTEAGATKMFASGGFIDKDGEMGYALFIDENSELFNATSAVVAKIKFTAQKDIADISDCFVIENVKNSYSDETGPIKSNISGVAVQLSETMAVQEVIDMINAIGAAVTYSSKAKIEAARTAYDAITRTSLKALVTNITILTSAEASLQIIEQRINYVKGLINALGTVTLQSEDAILEARAQYAALANDEKAALATEAGILANAESTLATLKQEAADKAAAQPVINQIEALFPVTLNSGAAIEAADEAYKALTADQQAYVTNYAKIAQARADLAELEALKKQEEDKAAAQPVINQIEALFPVTLESGEAIEAADAAYKALTADQQAYVTNYSRISEARQDLATLKAQKAAADEVAGLIALIPDVIGKDNAVAAREAIDTAKASYDALDAKNLVPDAAVAKLETALKTIAEVEKAISDAQAMDKAIDALFPVTLGSGDAIANAEALFDELSDLAEEYTTKKDDLDKARETYEALVDEENEVQRVIGLIDALGTPDGIDYGTFADVLAQAKDAEDALKNLDSTLVDQTRVPNRATLNDIIDRCLELQESWEKIQNVIEKIAKIASEPITLGSATELDVARGLYDALTPDEQAMVNNYGDLEEAEETLEQLIEEAEQEEFDRAKAAAVDALIDKIGNVEFTPECWKLISEAMQAYNALSDVQKGYVEGFGDLKDAEDEYLGLKQDSEAVDAVIKAIDKIGKVEYSDECLERIEDAEELYNNLEDRLKPEVTNAYMIDVAKQNYESAKQDAEAVENVIDKIDNLGEMSYTQDALDRLEDAQDAYDALRDDLKPLVTNYQALVEAWEAYNKLKPIIIQKNDITGYEGMNVTVVLNVSENFVVSFGSNEAQIVEIDGKIYHVLITETVLSPEDVVLTAGAPADQILGSILKNNDELPTALDALAVNSRAANNVVDIFANDSNAYLRADVNGSGSITAMDALMIAKKALGETVYFKMYVGMKANN